MYIIEWVCGDVCGAYVSKRIAGKFNQSTWNHEPSMYTHIRDAYSEHGRSMLSAFYSESTPQQI